MDYFKAIILAVVEGVTEFLPISSTGHLVLASRLLNVPQTEFVKSFEISIQLGAILAVVILYWRIFTTRLQILGRVLAAFVPTGILGFTFYSLVKDVLLGNVLVTLVALFLGGVFLVIFEKFYKSGQNRLQIEEMTVIQSVLIGLVQSFSIIPGVSRAAATIFGGLFVGLSRKAAVEFSFLVAVPTMVGATSLDLFKTRFQFGGGEYGLLGLGFVGAFITALLTIKFFLNFVQNHTFVAFGVYRILLAVIFWLAVR